MASLALRARTQQQVDLLADIEITQGWPLGRYHGPSSWASDLGILIAVKTRGQVAHFNLGPMNPRCGDCSHLVVDGVAVRGVAHLIAGRWIGGSHAGARAPRR